MFEWIGATATRLALASLLPVGVLVGAIYFVVDTALRGIEQSVDVTNDRVSDMSATLSEIRGDLTELRIAVAQLDVSTTARLDSIVESLRDISLEITAPNNRTSSVETGYEGIDRGLPSMLTVETAAHHPLEILTVAVQRELAISGMLYNDNDCLLFGESIYCSPGARSTLDVPETTDIGASEVLHALGASAEGYSEGELTLDAIPVRRPIAGSILGLVFFTDGVDPVSGLPTPYVAVGFAVAEGTTAVASANGSISSVELRADGGFEVRIEHAFNIETRYFNLNPVLVEVGDIVHSGDPIGAVVRTDGDFTTHLRFEMYVAGEQIDPMRPFRLIGGQRRPPSPRPPNLGELGPNGGTQLPTTNYGNEAQPPIRSPFPVNRP